MDVLIAGVGSIGQKEVRELTDHPQINVVGVVDTDVTRGNSVTSLVPDTYTDLAEAITKSDPDLVRISTPPRTHFDLAQTALNAGTDVYIEKIMTLTADNAREIVQLADDLDQEVYVRRNAVYTPVYQQAWDRLDEIGELRKIHWIEPVGEYSDWSTSKGEWLRDLPGGIVSEHLPHALYTVRWFLDEEPTVENVDFTGHELYVTLETESRKVDISYVKASDVPMLLTLTGSEGSLFVNHSTMRVRKPRGFEDASSVEQRTIKANFYELFGNIQNMVRLGSHYVRRELDLRPNPLYSQSDNYRQFTDIAEGRNTVRSFSIQGEEGVKNVKVFEEIWNNR